MSEGRVSAQVFAASIPMCRAKTRATTTRQRYELDALLGSCHLGPHILDEYRKKPSKADYRRKKLGVFDHKIHQKLPTDVVGVPFDAR